MKNWQFCILLSELNAIQGAVYEDENSRIICKLASVGFLVLGIYYMIKEW